MFSIIKKNNGKIRLQWKEYENLNIENICSTFKISPLDFYSTISECGRWIENTSSYEFNTYGDAARVVDKMESRLVMNKLIE